MHQVHVKQCLINASNTHKTGIKQASKFHKAHKKEASSIKLIPNPALNTELVNIKKTSYSSVDLRHKYTNWSFSILFQSNFDFDGSSKTSVAKESFAN